MSRKSSSLGARSVTAKRSATAASWSRPGPFCRLRSRTPAMPARGANWSRGIERKRSRRIVGIALPGDADLETADGAEPLAPPVRSIGLGEQVGDLGRDRRQGGPEQPRQAHQRGMDVELGERLPLRPPPPRHRGSWPGAGSAAAGRPRSRGRPVVRPGVHSG